MAKVHLATNTSFRQLSEDERPREKALNHGIQSLSDAELLSLLGYAPGEAGDIGSAATGNGVTAAGRQVGETSGLFPRIVVEAAEGKPERDGASVKSKPAPVVPEAESIFT